MTVEVGYITSWRKAVFFSLIVSVVFFGTVSTLCTAYLPIKLIANIVSAGALVLCIAGFIMVLADKGGRYTGKGTGNIDNGVFVYSDKKRHFEIPIRDIKKTDVEKILLGNSNTSAKPIAYRMLIKTDKKKYYIESDKALGREYNEVDLYRLYIYLQENINRIGEDIK